MKHLCAIMLSASLECNILENKLDISKSGRAESYFLMEGLEGCLIARDLGQQRPGFIDGGGG